VKKYFLVIFLCALFFSFATMAYAEDGGRKIVVFKPGVKQELKEKVVREAGGFWAKHLDTIDGAAVTLPAGAEKIMKSSSLVEGIYPDAIVRPAEVAVAGGQEIPWGITRIGADRAWATSTGEGVRVAVIDSGIDLDHPDLKDNIKGGYNAVKRKDSFDDGFGHGTHVAGIIAALNNSYGVVGTSYNVSLYGVKVLDDTGAGRLSDLIEGLAWSVFNRMQVVNISLETSEDLPPFRKAIAKTYAAGVVIVAAAGNGGGETAYPAAYPEVIAVSAVDGEDNIAPWSNSGKIELTAPGVDILSTVPVGFIPDSAYFSSSGTSMACPHVSGTVALLLASKISRKYDFNHNGKWDPAEVKKKLQDSSETLPALTPAQQGWGLVRADHALK